MTYLIAMLSTGKGTWAEVSKLMEEDGIEKTFLITTSFGEENFSSDEEYEMVLFDRDDSVEEKKEKIMAGLREDFGFEEAALNLASGSGEEHMALLAALLELGVGFRLVRHDRDEGFQEL